MKINIISFLLLASYGVQAESWTAQYNLQVPSALPSTTLAKEKSYNDQNYLVSGLKLDLNEILGDSAYLRNKSNTVIIVADTLEIPQNALFNIKNQNMFIFARNIIGDGTVGLNLNAQSGNANTLAIFADEVTTNIDIVSNFSSSDGQIDRLEIQDGSLGSLVFAANGNTTITPITPGLAELISVQKSTYLDVFEKSFDMAASIYDQNPQLSLDMLTWIEKVLVAAPSVRESTENSQSLYLQIASLKQFLQFSILNKNYVPSLSADLYETTFTAYLDAMEAYQASYERFLDRDISLEDRKNELVLMQANINDAVAAENQIIDNSTNQIAGLKNSLRQQQREYEEQENNVFSASIAFDDGILKYKQDQITQIGLEVAQVVASAGKAFAGAAAGDTSGLGDLASSIAETTQKITELKKSIEDISALIDDVRKISGDLELLSAQSSSSISSDELAASFSKLSILVPTKEQANLVWDEFIILIKAEMQSAIDLDIDGASDYRVSLEKLINQGKAITATEINIAQEQSRQIDLRITSEVNANHADRINIFIQNTDNSLSEIKHMEQALFRTINNLKRPMFVALTNYEAAYNYWALDENDVTPSLNKSYDEYRRDLASLREQEAASLERFSPRPQDFSLAVMELNHSQQLKDFSGDGEVSFNIGLDNVDFAQFDRIRLDEVNVVIKGKNLPEDQTFAIDVRTTGNYQDRLRDEKFDFSAAPLFRRVSYKLVDSEISETNIITTGAIADDYAINYFKPTPFATWSIQLRNPHNYDLSQVESIQVSFKGNAIPRN